MPAKALVSWAWDPFADTSGAPTAFPIAVGQLQFYVNHTVLAAVGLRDPTRWTWGAFEQAAMSRGPVTVTGWGWGNPATWRALVYGLVGTLIASPIDPQAALQIKSATTHLFQLAWHTSWGPQGDLGTGDAGTPIWDLFAQAGWSQQRSQAVTGIQAPPGSYAPMFAFMPPWTMDVLSGNALGVQTFPPDCHAGGGCSLVPRSFPTLPTKDVVPTFAWGLQPRTSAVRPERLAAFVKWLYAPDQQRALGALGLEPLIDDSQVQAEWRKMAPAGSPVPLFDGTRYFSPSYKFLAVDMTRMPYASLFTQVYLSRRAAAIAPALAQLGIATA